MKRITIYIILIVVAGCIASCLKDKPNVDFSGIGPIAEISYATTNPTNNAPTSGYAYFPQATLNFTGASDPDTVWFTVNIASTTPPTKDIGITVGIDQSALAKFNTDTVTNIARIQYEVLPDSTFSFVSTTGTIHAGSNLDTFYLVFHPSIIDPTHSYMLPISITDASGVTISGNLGTIYFHLIGNPLAGNYDQEWIRYNTATQTPPPAFDLDLGITSFIPVSPVEFQVTSGTGMTYYVSFVNTAGVFSNFTIAFPSSGAGSASANGITISGGPTIITADPIAGFYQFNFTYINGAGSPRNITDKFTKQ